MKNERLIRQRIREIPTEAREKFAASLIETIGQTSDPQERADALEVLPMIQFPPKQVPVAGSFLQTVYQDMLTQQRDIPESEHKRERMQALRKTKNILMNYFPSEADGQTTEQRIRGNQRQVPFRTNVASVVVKKNSWSDRIQQIRSDITEEEFQTLLRRELDRQSTMTPPDPDLVQEAIDGGQWRNFAQCRGAKFELFFLNNELQSKVKIICTGCPVKNECLADALQNNQQFGVWGGVAQEEREGLSKEHPKPTPPDSTIKNLQTQSVITLSQTSLRISDIAVRTGLSESVVKKILREHDISLPQDPAPQPETLKEDDIRRQRRSDMQPQIDKLRMQTNIMWETVPDEVVHEIITRAAEQLGVSPALLGHRDLSNNTFDFLDGKRLEGMQNYFKRQNDGRDTMAIIFEKAGITMSFEDIKTAKSLGKRIYWERVSSDALADIFKKTGEHLGIPPSHIQTHDLLESFPFFQGDNLVGLLKYAKKNRNGKPIMTFLHEAADISLTFDDVVLAIKQSRVIKWNQIPGEVIREILHACSDEIDKPFEQWRSRDFKRKFALFNGTSTLRGLYEYAIKNRGDEGTNTFLLRISGKENPKDQALFTSSGTVFEAKFV